MIPFKTQTIVQNIDAEAALTALLEHLSEHDLIAHKEATGWRLHYDGDATIFFVAKNFSIAVDITAPSQESLFNARMLAHHHIVEFAHCDFNAIKWQGDQPVFLRPPSFRVLTVIAIENLTPHLREIRFQCDDLVRFASNDDIHCKLLLPQPGITAPTWPTMDDDGLPHFPTGDQRLDIRTYTIRRIDAKAGWMDIIFVLHDDAGPGSNWGTRAQIGDQIGCSGPGGRTAKSADWLLLAGDETALPAIARIAEKLPAHTLGEIFIEISNKNDVIPLACPVNMQVHWLYRELHTPGTSPLLLNAIQSCNIPKTGELFAWVAAEFSTAQSARTWLRDTAKLGGKEQLVVAYWRLGMDETKMKSGGKRQPSAQAAEKSTP